MFSCMVELDAVEERETRHVGADGPDREALLVAWLNELIYLFDVEAMVFNRFGIHEMDETHLKAICYGERLDPERHKFNLWPKAATYHMVALEKESEPAIWRPRVILDI